MPYGDYERPYSGYRHRMGTAKLRSRPNESERLRHVLVQVLYHLEHRRTNMYERIYEIVNNALSNQDRY